MPAAMPWAFLAASLLGALFTWNAFRPTYRPAGVAAVSFFAGWLTSELALHHLVWAGAVVVGFVWAGALSAWPGWVALGVSSLSCLGLVGLYRRAALARSAVDAALRRSLGPEYDAGVHDAAATIDWRQVLLPLPVRHPDVERIADVVFHEHGKLRLKLDVHRGRRARSKSPALVWIHGGAWVIGTKETQGLPLMQHLASRGWVCFAIQYRLSPRATFPDHVVDVKRAINWVRRHAEEYGADPDMIVVAGGSAGGHLAALAALTAGDRSLQPGFEDADTSVAGCVPLYGIYDLADRDALWPNPGLEGLLARHVLKATREGAPDAYDRGSPLCRIHPGAPPFFVIHGELDGLVPVAHARLFADALRGVASHPVVYAEIPGAQHAFDIFPSVRTLWVVHGIERFGAWLQKTRSREKLVG